MISEKWNVLKVSGPKHKVEILCAKIEDYSLGALYNEEITDIYIKPNNKQKVNSVLDEFSNDSLSFQWEILHSKDWHLMWQEHFTSINIRDEIQILPDWDKTNSSGKIKSIFIRPGMSFGTGHHETTYLMLESLLDYKEKKLSLLDLGSGSGILSITAQKLGFSNITSVEYDEVCKEDYLYNLKINDCDDINMNWADATLWTDFNYNLILANIEKNILKRILKNINKSNGVFILSGILEEDKGDMEDYLNKNNFIVSEIRQRNEWIAITCSKI